MSPEEHRKRGWIGVDLDGTLAYWDGVWKGIDVIGAPLEPMVARVKAWLAEGKTVKIFTARISDFDGRPVEKAVRAIEDWTEKHIGVRLAVTNIKDPMMVELWDDRAVQVVPNTGQPLCLNDS